MFHWICPECGQEIAPGVKECPVCDPQTSAAPVPSSGPLATMASPREASPPEVPPAVNHPPAVMSPPVVMPVLEEPPVVLQPEVQEPEILQPEIMVAKAQGPIIAQTPRPEAQAPLPEAETFADRLADLAESLHGERLPYGSPRIIESTAAPHREIERAPAILDVTPARPLLEAPPTVLLLAEPQPPTIAVQLPAKEVFKPKAVPGASPRAVSSKPAEAEVSAPNPVQLPSQQGRSAAPALAKLQSYFEAADRLMGLAVCEAKPVSTADEPRITLPGPALPRELLSLQAAGLVPIGLHRGRAGSSNSYNWIARIAVTAILLTAGLAATYRVMPGVAAIQPATPVVTPAAEPVPVPRPDNSHSLARFVEVSGIRFVELNKKPQIHYLVVNHSSAPLQSVTVYVTLRAINAKSGQAPLARFMFRSPILAAHEAKEMANPIEHVIGPLDLPDWQDLRADVEVQ